MKTELIIKIKEMARKLVVAEDKYNNATQVIRDAEAVQMEALVMKSELSDEWEQLIRELAKEE